MDNAAGQNYKSFQNQRGRGKPVPTRGLSLVGFMDQQRQALDHLRNFCVLSEMSEAALLGEWAAARAKVGAPHPRAGAPDIREIEPPDDAYVRELRAQPWVQTVFQAEGYRDAAFKLVEIEPLLAHQPFVDVERSDHVCKRLRNSAVAELMPLCLPRTQPAPLDPPTVIVQEPQSLIIKSRDLQIETLRTMLMTVSHGGYDRVLAGMEISWSLPFVHVVRLSGRYYLLNGYHRALGAAKVGVTHIPCLLREVPGEADPAWLMMPRRLFASSNPPTMGHFLHGRTHEVRLRAISRILHVTWSHHLMPDEYEGIGPRSMARDPDA